MKEHPSWYLNIAKSVHLQILKQMSQLASSMLRRCLHTTTRLLQKQKGDNTSKNTGDITKHLNLLKSYYKPELLQSIQIAESVVPAKDYLDLKLHGRDGLSSVPPTNLNFDYSREDPEWTEPILYPNQGLGRVPYPPIPQVASPDRDDMKIRFAEARHGPNDIAKNVSVVKNNPEIARGLAQLTGLDEQYIKNLYVRALVMKRVAQKTSKGNVPSFWVMSVAGDMNGMIGLGIGKSRDGIRTAASKAHWQAVKNMQKINRYDNRTILQSFETKYHGVKLNFKPAPIGFGLRCNHIAFEICQAAGIKDIRGKIFESRNPFMVAKGFVEALTKQKTIQELSLNRGKKIVELRKVYYQE